MAVHVKVTWSSLDCFSLDDYNVINLQWSWSWNSVPSHVVFMSPAHSKILFTDSVKVHRESHSIINRIIKTILLLCKVSYWKATKASLLSVKEKKLYIGTTGFESGWSKMSIASLWCAPRTSQRSHITSHVWQTVDNSNWFRKFAT